MPDDAAGQTDGELLSAYAGGDVGAFETLYKRHRDWVAAVAMRFTRDRHESLDVLQETFAYLASCAPTLKPTVSLRGFLYPVVKHNSLAVRRKLRRRVLAGDDPALSLGQQRSGIEERVVPREADMSGLRMALSALSDAHREVLLMKVVDEMSLSEIALALSIPVGTVKSRVHHALQTLRQDERTRRYFEAE